MAFDKNDPTVMAWNNLADACRAFSASHSRAMKLAGKKNQNGASEAVQSRAVAQTVLNLYALKEAVELLSGEWHDGDVELALAALRGEVSLVDTFKKQVREEKMAEMLDGAVVHDEDGNELSLPAGEYAFTITDAWRDDDGQTHVCVRRTDDE